MISRQVDNPKGYMPVEPSCGIIVSYRAAFAPSVSPVLGEAAVDSAWHSRDSARSSQDQ
jgi:hypothetical protein